MEKKWIPECFSEEKGLTGLKAEEQLLFEQHCITQLWGDELLFNFC